MCNNNINAFGCDLKFKSSKNENILKERNIIRLMDNYNIPSFEINREPKKTCASFLGKKKFKLPNSS